MDEEQIEESLKDIRLIKDVLGMDINHFERHKDFAMKGLMKFGDSFAYRLGILLKSADLKNSVIILNIWKNECTQHDLLYRIHQAKKEAEKNETLNS